MTARSAPVVTANRSDLFDPISYPSTSVLGSSSRSRDNEGAVRHHRVKRASNNDTHTHASPTPHHGRQSANLSLKKLSSQVFYF
mmetsp:Transcript_29659/g.71713  ORF Transcript_29659/g.71713 Transcript_29659/m.71713 type:complete len:84 (+) Transcript_29659:317-568(+)